MHLTLCDYLMDMVQNAVEAGAGEVVVKVTEDGNNIEVLVEDNGKGMDAATLKQAFSPFYTEPGKHPGRRVGLGLPFLKQAVEQTGGALEARSALGKGTEIRFRFPAGHADTPPAGDWAGTWTALMAQPGEFELRISRRRGPASYDVARKELIDALGELATAETLLLARQYLESQENGLKE